MLTTQEDNTFRLVSVEVPQFFLTELATYADIERRGYAKYFPLKSVAMEELRDRVKSLPEYGVPNPC